MGITCPVVVLLETSCRLTDKFDADYFPFFFWICMWAGFIPWLGQFGGEGHARYQEDNRVVHQDLLRASVPPRSRRSAPSAGREGRSSSSVYISLHGNLDMLHSVKTNVYRSISCPALPEFQRLGYFYCFGVYQGAATVGNSSPI